MPSRNTWPLAAMSAKTVTMAGSFAPNGAGAVDTLSRKGRGFTVARTGVGVFRLTFTDKWNDLVAGKVSVQLNAFADTDVLLGAFSQANKTLDLFVKTAGVAADIAANANNRIHFELRFSDTGLPIRGT